MSEDGRLVVTLKEDWDHPQHYLRPGGHFVGRRTELDFLFDSMRRRNNGSILVSGARGVGKTALVYKALQRLVEDNPNTVCAVLNVSDLDIDMGKALEKEPKPSLQMRESIIKNLIRRLYLSLSDKADAVTKSGLDRLYMKAIARDTVEKEVLESEATGGVETSRKITRAFRSRSNIGAFLTSYLLGILLSLHPPLAPSNTVSIMLNVMLPLLAASIGPLTLMYARESIEERQSQARSRMKASQYYEFDAGLATLQFDLEHCLDRLRDLRYKVVFCIDELDKLEKPELVIDIITSFKNLFNLSFAIFVVITGPTEYNLIDQAKQDRGTRYTLFTNRVFVSHPSFKDLEGFVDEIVEKPEHDLLEKSELYNDFLNYVCYLAMSDFFDLHSVVRDFIVGYDDSGKPLMQIPRLDPDQVTIARLQKCLGLIYGRYQKPQLSAWAYNDQLLTEIYKFVSWLLAQKPNSTFTDQFPDVKMEDFREVRKDLCIYLSRVEALKWVGQTAEHYNSYVWTGSCPPVPSRIDALLSYEQDFVGKYDRLVEAILSFTNTYLSALSKPLLTRKDFESNLSQVLGITLKAVDADFKPIFDKQKPFYDDLHTHFPDSYTRDQLVNLSRSLEDQYGLLDAHNRKFLLVKNMARDALKDASVASLTDNLALFSTIDDLRKAVIDSKIEHAVISKKDLARQVLITSNLPPEVIPKNRTLLRQNSRVLQVINIQTKGELSYVKMNGFKNLNLIQGLQDAPKLIQGLAKWYER